MRRERGLDLRDVRLRARAQRLRPGLGLRMTQSL